MFSRRVAKLYLTLCGAASAIKVKIIGNTRISGGLVPGIHLQDEEGFHLFYPVTAAEAARYVEGLVQEAVQIAQAAQNGAAGAGSVGASDAQPVD